MGKSCEWGIECAGKSRCERLPLQLGTGSLQVEA